MENQDLTKLKRRLNNFEEELESFQYFVNKKIGRESGYIPTSKIPGARQYDAIVDTKGQGDFKTIQEALDAGNKRIYLRSGMYDGGFITVNNGTVIVGESNNSVEISGTCTIANDNTIISGIYFKDFAGATGIDHHLTINAGDIIIENNRFENSTYGAIQLKTDVNNTAENIIISNNYFDFSSNSENVIETSGAVVDSSIINNYFNKTPQQSTDSLIRISTSSSAIMIVGNYLYGASYGIYSDSDTIMIGSNYFSSAGVSSIYITGDYNNVSNNTLNRCDSSGIVLDGSRGTIINGNLMYKTNDVTASSVILLKNTSTYSVISGNSFFNTGGSPPAYCYRENSTSDDYNTITGNVFQNATTANVSIQGANSIKSNNIE